jgi:hypothetical protein
MLASVLARCKLLATVSNRGRKNGDENTVFELVRALFIFWKMSVDCRGTCARCSCPGARPRTSVGMCDSSKSGGGKSGRRDEARPATTLSVFSNWINFMGKSFFLPLAFILTQVTSLSWRVFDEQQYPDNDTISTFPARLPPITGEVYTKTTSQTRESWLNLPQAPGLWYDSFLSLSLAICSRHALTVSPHRKLVPGSTVRTPMSWSSALPQVSQ